MRNRILRDTSIVARLGALTAFISLAMGGIFWITLQNFTKLSEDLISESSNSMLVIESAEGEHEFYQSWISLMTAAAARSEGPGSVAGAVAKYDAALGVCQDSFQSLKQLQGLSPTLRSAIAEVNDAFAAYVSETRKTADTLKSGTYKDDDSMMASLRFEVMVGKLANLFGQTKMSSLAMVNSSKAGVAKAKSLISLFSVLLILVVAAFGLFMTRTITRPLAGLVKAVDKIGAGDLTATVEYRSKDELGRIAASVNGLAVDLRNLVLTVKEKLTTLDVAGGTLASNMEETSASVVQINSNIGNARGLLEGQSTAVKEVIAAIEGLTRKVYSLSELIQRQSGAVSQSSASVEEMIANIESVAENVEGAAQGAQVLASTGREGKERIDQVNETVDAIVRYSKNLNEAAGLIAEIADRTNILAMNAAIEASHAGEAGKGFAVISDEIRRLAEQSTGRSKDISVDLERVAASIQSVREATGSAVESFGAVLERSAELGSAVSRIGGAMREQRVGGRQVLESLSALVGITREISDEAAAMKSGNASVLQKIEALDSTNRLVVQNSDEIRQGTREINEAITATGDLTSHTKELIGDVMEAATKFII